MILNESFSSYQNSTIKSNDCLINCFINPSSIKSSDINTPAHFWYKFNNPEPETEPMRVGKAFHSLVLEPDKFSNEYFLIDRKAFGESYQKNKNGSPNMRDKYNKIILNKIESENSDKICLNIEQSELIINMRDSLLKHIPNLYKIIDLKSNYGKAEQSLYCFAKFKEVGVFEKMVDFNIEWFKTLTPEEKLLLLPTKTRPDYYYFNGQAGYALDLKTCGDASYNSFSKDIQKYGYHVQAAFVLDCLNAVLIDPFIETSTEPEIQALMSIGQFNLITIEKTPPYLSANYRCVGEMLQLGREIYVEKLEAIHKIFYEIKTKNISEEQFHKYFKGYEIFSDIFAQDNEGNLIDYKMQYIDLSPYAYIEHETRKRKQESNNKKNF